MKRGSMATGILRPPVTLAELGAGYKLIFCFQYWCEGCHVTGFAALKRMVEALGNRGAGFAVAQTVFEGFEADTADQLRQTQLRYALMVPFGPDGAKDECPGVMLDYRTGGSPWVIVIGPAGQIVPSDFRIDAERAIALPAVEPGCV